MARGTTLVDHKCDPLVPTALGTRSAAPLTPGKAAQATSERIHLGGSGGNFCRGLPGGPLNQCARVPVGFDRPTFLCHSLMEGIIAERRGKGKRNASYYYLPILLIEQERPSGRPCMLSIKNILMNDRSHFFAEERFLQSSLVPQVEHVDQQLVLHAHGDRRRVHDTQAKVDEINIR